MQTLGNDVSATIRDRVWAAVVEALLAGEERLTLDGILAAADLEAEQRETARLTLNAAADLGVLDHAPGSPRWIVADDVREALVEAGAEERAAADRALRRSWHE